LDPQQRILLELSWEAMESAGLDPENLAGSDTGVFVGGFTVDHLLNQFGTEARDNIGSHSASGATLTMLSNRISYAFDFHGPSFSIDTACSSSLVAFSQAVSAIKSNQCEVALVGGVNFMLRPEYTVAMSKGRFLAKDGRSKSFDSRADGYGRGEGGGVLVLKNLAAAQRDNDPILAIVAGVGVNQDGRTSGITVPNPDAQRDLMIKVLADSGCDADEISYVEAHGTGTAVGDPLETKAIAEVYGTKGSCVVGSVKASIGHLEAAAGVASVIKSVMMLQRNLIPPVAGLGKVNPAIPPSISLPRSAIPLQLENKPATIAINSFGYGGTNAHLILSSPATANHNKQNAALLLQRQQQGEQQSVRLLPISARDEDALRARAEQFITLLNTETTELDDILYTASQRRGHLSHRLAVWGKTKEELQLALRQHLDGKTPIGCAQGERNSSGNSNVVFIYTGMGPQWHGMGRDLFENNEIFRNTLLDADRAFQAISGFSILEEMLKDEEHSQIKRTEFAQPGNLMVQMGLTAVLRDEGVHPAAVVGHSVGEVASAWASGMLTLEEALLVSCQRSKIQATAAGMGKMLALGVSEAEAAELIAPYGDKVSLAAINSPASVTVAGDANSLDEICVQATERNLFARMLDVAVPYHSPMMEQLKPELRKQLASLEPASPALPLYSTVTGTRTGHKPDTRLFDAEYWCDNVRDPVYFAQAIRSTLNDGFTLFVEVGPHPVLRRATEDVFKEQGVEANVVATLWMNKPEQSAIKQSVADIFVSGGNVDWHLREPYGELVQLPNYPWQRKKLWRESIWQAQDRLESQVEPLFDDRSKSAGADLNLSRLNYLFDHKVDGTSIMPAAGFIEALCQKARKCWPQSDERCGLSLRNITINEALILDQDRSIHLRVVFDEFTNKAQLVATDAQTDKPSIVHAEAQLYPLLIKKSPHISANVLLEFDGEAVAVDTLYEELSGLSLQYGPAFQAIVALSRNRARQEVLVTLQRPECAGEDASAYILHPSLLDGCFQSALSLIESHEPAYLPVSLESIQIFESAPEKILCHTRIISKNDASIICDFDLADEAGNIFTVIKGLRCISLRGKAETNHLPKGDYQRIWNTLPPLENVDREVGFLAIIANPADSLADALVEVCCSIGTAHQRFEFGELRDGSALQAATHLAVISDAGLNQETDATGQDGIEDLLELVKGLISLQQQCKLRVITRQAASINTGDQVIPAQTAVAGFMRVVRNEQELLNATLIDTAPEKDLYHQAQCLFVEILNADTIDEIALRNGQRYGVELVRSAALEQQHTTEVQNVENTPIRIEKTNKNKTTSYRAHILSNVPTAASNQYKIRITRLAFKPDNEDYIGICGIIIHAGTETTQLKPGDHVCGIIPHQLASHVVVSEQNTVLVKVCSDFSHHPLQATIAVIEAQAALIEHSYANLTDGCILNPHVLIDNSELGEALGRRLKRAGATVILFDDYDTTSNERFNLIAGPLAKWSRTFGFTSLKDDGCLVDLSEKQTPFAIPTYCAQFIRMPHELQGMKKSRRFAPMLKTVITEATASKATEQTELSVQTLLELNSDLNGGNGVENKWLEITLPDSHEQNKTFSAVAPEAPCFSSNGAYLVTGGFGGLGAEVANWLASNGAGHIALVSRRGEASPGAKALIESLQENGASVSGYAVDMADKTAVRQLMQTLCLDDKPLRGIFHAAGVLKDNLVADLKKEDIAKVMQVKAGGAQTMHCCLQELQTDVEHFVLFSSIANLVGNSRQANYCAANGFLDGLAHHRRALGLSALSINFGAIAEVGMLEGDSRVEQHLTQIGLAPLKVGIALRGVGLAMVQNQTQIAIAETIAWERWAAYEVIGGTSPAFSKLVAESRDAQGGDASLIEQLHRAVQTMTEEEGRQILRALIADVIALALKTSADRLKPDLAFDSFGVDSLMSTEIQIQLDQAIGINYSVVELLGHSTINSLVEKAFNEIAITN
ncbi:MAG: SDR family NAD(P)-dependent oxidoreductase, partial [Pseudomonadales bacterium]|nr:SDR family NAD(P)-dependent oxidoreductase [Pseudomonadales bacterium]